MTAYVNSAVMIVPAALRDTANTMAAGMQWGPANFSREVRTTGASETTHYALHAAATPTLTQGVQGAGLGQVPQGLEQATGLTAAQILACFGAMVVSIEPAGQRTPYDHFAAVLAANGMVEG